MNDKKKLKTTIHDLAFGGDGVGRIDGKVCFVRDALPGEEVLFDVVKETKSYVKGNLVEIINRSPGRVEPVCKYYGSCGGCQYQHLEYSIEVDYKRKQVEDLFLRVGGIEDFKLDKIIPSDKPYNYRSHITLLEKKGKYGFFTRDDRELLELDSCCIAEESINDILPFKSQDIKKDRIVFKSDHEGNVKCSAISGERFFWDRFSDKDIMLSPRTFSQCNRKISVTMAEMLGEWIGPRGDDTAFFDLFCGVGFFSYLLEDFSMCIGMDFDRTAIDCAKTTAKEKGIRNKIFFRVDIETDVAKIFNEKKMSNNILLIDPPRKGLTRNFTEWLKSKKEINKIYFISCDPARMARDIQLITDHTGWKVSRSAMFDMFPRTKHVEVMIEMVP